MKEVVSHSGRWAWGALSRPSVPGAEWARERQSCRQKVEGRERRPRKPALHLGEIQDSEDKSDRI